MTNLGDTSEPIWTVEVVVYSRAHVQGGDTPAEVKQGIQEFGWMDDRDIFDSDGYECVRVLLFNRVRWEERANQFVRRG